MNHIKERWLAARIELHWMYIIWCRKRGTALLDHGEPLNSERLLKLARKIDRHGMAVFRLQDLYETQYVRSRPQDLTLS